MSMLTKTELNFKQNLRNLRAASNKSAYAIAQELGIDKAYYYRLENDAIHMHPSYDTLEKISDLYKIPVYQLFI